MTRKDRWKMLAQAALRAATPSMREVAERASVPYSTVRSWNAGTRVPRQDQLSILADIIERQGNELRTLAEQLRGAASGGT